MKAATLETRKPVDALTRSDVTRYAVWEYALDEETLHDETWVRPVVRVRLGRGLYSQLVRSCFWTARDERLLGFMVVSTDGPEPEITPGALLQPRYLPLPTLSRAQAVQQRAPWALTLRGDILRALRRREATIFPMRYELQVPLGRSAALATGRIR